MAIEGKRIFELANELSELGSGWYFAADKTGEAEAVKVPFDLMKQVFSPSIIEITRSEAELKVQNNELVSGGMYAITDADVDLYGGTKVLIQATSSNKFSCSGYGYFYNPKYTLNTLGFGIYDRTGDTLYQVDDVVIWGGKFWTCTDGNIPNFEGVVNSEFQLHPNWFSLKEFDENDFELVVDSVEYDFDNDLINSRYDGDNLVRFSLKSLKKLSGDFLSGDYISDNPIRNFQWGNPFDYDEGFGIGSQKIIDSINQNINFRGYFQIGFFFTGLSWQYNVKIGQGCSQQYFRFDGGSGQIGCELYGYSDQRFLNFSGGSFQSQIFLLNGSFQWTISLRNSSSQQNINFDGNAFQYSVDLTNQSYQFAFNFENGGSQTFVTLDNSSYQSDIAITNESTQNNCSIRNQSKIQGTIIDNFSYFEKVSVENNSSVLYMSLNNSQFINSKIDCESIIGDLAISVSTVCNRLSFFASQLNFGASNMSNKTLYNVEFYSVTESGSFTAATHIFNGTHTKKALENAGGNSIITYYDASNVLIVAALTS